MTEYGLQLYSVRDSAEKDFRETLRRVAEMGYRYVEFAGFFNHPASDVKAWLEEYGLKASGSHIQLPALTPETIEETIAYHKAIGCTNIIIPTAKWDTEEEMNDNLEQMIRVQKRLAEEGLELGYHNHSREFYCTPYGKFIEDELIANTDLFLEFDTFWLFNAGIDPIAYCEANKDRIGVIHIKDGIPPVDMEREFATAQQGVTGTSLGSGKAPVREVREWAIQNNILMVVESEGLKPTGLEEVQRCMDFLRTLEA